MASFRIMIADDHPIVRLGLRSLFASHPDWEVCAEASDGRTAVEKCRHLRPDLVVLDIGMPYLNGLDAARLILKDNPDQRVLVLTDVDREDVIRHCIEAGVRGWVFKSDGADDLILSVEAMQRNKSIFSSRVSSLIERRYLMGGQRGAPEPKLPELSSREREVVQLVAEGYSTKEVATLLKVTVKTVDSHRTKVMRKLDLHSVVHLVMYAVRNGIVQMSVPGQPDAPVFEPVTPRPATAPAKGTVLMNGTKKPRGLEDVFAQKPCSPARSTTFVPPAARTNAVRTNGSLPS